MFFSVYIYVDLRRVAQSTASLQTTSSWWETLGGFAGRQRKRAHHWAHFTLQSSFYRTAQFAFGANCQLPGMRWNGCGFLGQCIKQHPRHRRRGWTRSQRCRCRHIRRKTRVARERIHPAACHWGARDCPEAARGKPILLLFNARPYSATFQPLAVYYLVNYCRNVIFTVRRWKLIKRRSYGRHHISCGILWHRAKYNLMSNVIRLHSLTQNSSRVAMKKVFHLNKAIN